jgi:anti-sigma factor RsiW
VPSNQIYFFKFFRATGDSLNHFIHVLEPHDAAHVVEVVAHGEHDVIAGEAAGLSARIVQKLPDLKRKIHS